MKILITEKQLYRLIEQTTNEPKIYQRGKDPYEYKYENNTWFARKKGTQNWSDITKYQTSIDILNKEFPQNKGTTQIKSTTQNKIEKKSEDKKIVTPELKKDNKNTQTDKNSTNTNEQGNGIDVILMGGLDYRKGDLNINQQIQVLKKNLGNKNVVGRRYTDIEGIKNLIEKNPNAQVVLFSAGGGHSSAVASVIKDKTKLYIVEPYAASKNTSASVQNAVNLGVPSKNIMVGPSQGRGAGVVDGVTQTPKGLGHWDALGYVGSIMK